MAGSQDSRDNPVAINVVAMVDVIFCLCVFFMCSIKFQQLEGRFESWLPKNKGQVPSRIASIPCEMRFALLWDEANQWTVTKFGNRIVPDDETAQMLIRDSKADFDRIGQTDVPVIIDSDQEVPWEEVVNIINLAKREDVDAIEFAAGIEYDK